MFTHITPTLTPTKHPVLAAWRALSQRTRRALTVVLAIGLAFGGMVAVAAPAHAATETTAYINANGNASSVTATVLTATSASLSAGWYVCKSGTINTGRLTVATNATVNIILADGCTLDSEDYSDYGSGFFAQAGSTVNIYSQTGNTGRWLTYAGKWGAGMSIRNVLNVYGGYLAAYGGVCAAGIGGDWDWSLHGKLSFLGRSHTNAHGGDAAGGCGGGAGIGGGGSSNSVNTNAVGFIAVNSEGTVQAFGGAANGTTYWGGAHFGGGGAVNSGAKLEVLSYNVGLPTISPSGAASVCAVLVWNSCNTVTVSNVAVGSRVNWKATPNTGYVFSTKSSNLTAVGTSTTNFYQTAFINTSSLTYLSPTATTISASPTTQQTRPGDVILTANLKSGTTNLNGKTITFYDGTTNLGTANTNSAGNAALTLTSPAVGTKSYKATFTTDTSYVGSSSSALEYKVVPGASTLTLTASPVGTQTRPGNVTLTANLKSGTTNLNAQPVTFWVNDTQVGSAQTNALGIATYLLTAPAVGTYSLEARFAGDTNFGAATPATITGYQVIRASQGSTLTINGLGTTAKIYGDGPYNIDATGGSGTGSITLTSSNPTVASLTEVLLNTSETPVPPLLFGALLDESPLNSLLTSGVGSIDSDTGVLTLNEAGTFTLTATRAQDDTYLASTFTTPQFTVAEATPVATLTRTGGDTLTTPIDLTLQVDARGSGNTPQGLVQFYFKGTKLGDPLPLVDNNDGTAEVSLNGIPIEKMGSQNVSAVFLGDPGKYKTVTQSDDWYLGNMGYCKVEMPEA